MTESSLFHFSLLRIVTSQILRAAGIDRARMSVVDSLTEVFAKYLLVASSARDQAHLTGRYSAEPEDVRSALEQIGIFEITEVEEGNPYKKGSEAVFNFVQWCTGPTAREIRRCAGELDESDEFGAIDVAMPGASAGTVMNMSLNATEATALPEDLKIGGVDWLASMYRTHDTSKSFKQGESLTLIGLMYKEIRVSSSDLFKNTALEQSSRALLRHSQGEDPSVDEQDGVRSHDASVADRTLEAPLLPEGFENVGLSEVIMEHAASS